ncbi:MAG: hypothetical protein SFV19_04380 [Rhodospirillaceae bacterium]|nr:hypothetical protein [Rhodospirillaceae bacterium]
MSEITDVHGVAPEPELPSQLKPAIQKLSNWVMQRLRSEEIVITEPVYHFTSLDACRSIISSDEIWHTSIRQLNDPDELAFTYSILRRVLRYRMASSEVCRLTLNGFETTARQFPQWFSTFIASFSLAPDDSNQWDKYGDSERGVRLSLSPSVFSVEQAVPSGLPPLEQVFVSAVRYGPKGVERILNEAIDQIEHSIPDLSQHSQADVVAFAVELQKQLAKIFIWTSITNKRKKWLREREIRLIVTNDSKLLNSCVRTRLRNGKTIKFVAPTFKQACKASIRATGSLLGLQLGKYVTNTQEQEIEQFLVQQELKVPVEKVL